MRRFKNITKRGFSLLMILALLVGVMSVSAFAYDTDEDFSSESLDTAFTDGTNASEGMAAKIGETEYPTLAEAVDTANQAGGEPVYIELLGNVEDGTGIVIESGTNVTINFGGFTYTVSQAPLAGSPGTETECFQILKGAVVRLENGSVVADNPDIKMMVQNYGDLTLYGMTLDANAGTNGIGNSGDSKYVLSNNCGSAYIDGYTYITAKEGGGVAFDVYYWESRYPEGVRVTVAEGMTGRISGEIEVSDSVYAQLTVNGGTFTYDVSRYVPQNKTAAKNENGEYIIVDAPVVNNTFKIGGNMYPTLADAVAAANDGDIIELMCNVPDAEGTTIPSGKNITIDLCGNIYTLIGPGAGSAGTETNGFQFLAGSNITIRNGTINISENQQGIYRLIQSYADLRFENVNLEARNQLGGEDYALSFNNGNVVFTGDTRVTMTDSGSIAFDICEFASYPGVTVTFDADFRGSIGGKILYDSTREEDTLTVYAGDFEEIAASDRAERTAKDAICLIGGRYANDVSDYCAPGSGAKKNGMSGKYEIVQTPAVAIGEVEYNTLAEAIAEARLNDTITVLREIKDAKGVSVEEGKRITIDFNNHAYTVIGQSADGTEANGFSLSSGAEVTLKNGEIKIAKNCSGINHAILNYSKLTVENMTIDAKNLNAEFPLSFNGGSVEFRGENNIYIADGAKYAAGIYENSAVSFAENAAGTVNGAVLYDTLGKLSVSGNVSFGSIEISDNVDKGDADIVITGGVFANDVSAFVVDGKAQEAASGKISELAVELEAGIELSVGGSKTLKPILTPADARISSEEWRSDNENAVSVENGVVTAKGVGTAEITCVINGVAAKTNVSASLGVIDVNVENVEKTYDGEAVSIEVKNVGDGATVLYSETRNGEYGEENPSYVNAGEYTVWYKVSKPDHEDISGSATIKINKADYDMSGVSFADVEFVYNGEPKTIQISGALPDGVTVSYEGNGAVDAGRHPVVASFEGDEINHNPISSMAAAIVIAKANYEGLEISASESALEGAGRVTLRVSGVPQGGSVTVGCNTEGISVSDNGDGTYTAELPNISLTYVFSAVYAGNDNYNAAEAVCRVTVTAKKAEEGGGNGGGGSGGGGGSSGGGSSGGSSSGGDTTIVDEDVPLAGLPVVFDDVSTDGYYYDAVVWALENEITDGVSDTLFGTNQVATRAQVVTFLWRAAGKPEVVFENPFTDVKESDYYYKAVLWAVSCNITDGTSAVTFTPNGIVTRGQMVTFLWRLLSTVLSDEESTFEDVIIGDYYYDAVMWAYSNKITDGTSKTTFSPEKNCERGQIVTFIYRAMADRVTPEA